MVVRTAVGRQALGAVGGVAGTALLASLVQAGAAGARLHGVGGAPIVLGDVAVALSAVAAGVYLMRTVVRPLEALDRSARLASGEAAGERGFGALRSALRALPTLREERRQLEEAAAETARTVEAEKVRHGAAREIAIRQQKMVAGAIGDGLNRMVEGDLRFRLDEPFVLESKASEAVYETLRADFNAAMERMEHVMGVVLASTSTIRSGADEIAAAADDLSRRTEQQAASLEETAAALDQITATVKKTADGAVQARQAVADAKADAERSGEVVQNAVRAMGEIESSSRQIGQIIGVIDEIAFQTNLLALNAGVEAARAGDAGRGFAVVASEVRALAQRSADAAREIKGLISSSARQVASGVTLVGETGSALGRIVGRVGEINAVVVEIASSAEEQARGLDEVNAAVNQMDQVTQQNAAMVEESTAASHSLARETDALAALMNQFQTGAGESQTSEAAAPTTASAAAGEVVRLRVASGGRRPRGGDSQSWAEF